MAGVWEDISFRRCFDFFIVANSAGVAGAHFMLAVAAQNGHHFL
jgi:hypothetical protein